MERQPPKLNFPIHLKPICLHLKCDKCKDQPPFFTMPDVLIGPNFLKRRMESESERGLLQVWRRQSVTNAAGDESVWGGARRNAQTKESDVWRWKRNLVLGEIMTTAPLRNMTGVMMALVVENWCGAATIVRIGAGRGWEDGGDGGREGRGGLAPLSVSLLR